MEEGTTKGGNGVTKVEKVEKVEKRGWKWLIKHLIGISIVIIASYVLGTEVQYEIDKRNMKPEIIEKEVVTFVEKSKTETQDFLIHLNPDLDPDLALIIADAVDKSSAKYRLPRKLVCSIIRKESNINPFAKSRVNAVGLMQIMPKIHAKKYEGRNLWHIHVNVDVGCAIFREYLDLEKGNMKKTFHRYLSKNATKDQIDKYSGDIYGFWSKLEMFDYLTTSEREENKEKVVEVVTEEEPTTHSQQMSLQPVLRESLTK